MKRDDVRNSVKRLVRVGLFINESESIRDKKHNALILRRPFWQALLQAKTLTKNPDTRQILGFIAEMLNNIIFNNNGLTNKSTSDTENSYAADAIYKNSIYRTTANSTKFQLNQ